jgi:glycosyl transferase family 87
MWISTDRSRTLAVVLGFSLIAIGLWQTVPNFLLAAKGESFGDFERQWAVCQYIRAGQNPYAVALAIVRHGQELGWSAPPMLTDIRSVPGWKEAEGVLPDFQPPDATYPPSAILFLTYTAGLLPASWSAPAWALLNLVLLVFLASRLIRQAIPSAPGMAVPAALVAAGFILAWPPTQAVLYANQFTFLAMAAALLALDAVETSTWRAGLWFALALSKPSITLLFLCYPIIRNRIGVVLIAGAVHAAALLVVSWLVGCPAPDLVRQWLEYARHCLWTMYSVQEILSRLNPNPGPIDAIVRLFLLGSVILWCWYHRAAPKERIVDFLCFANLLWVGHGNYDFTLLLLPAMHCLRRIFQVPEAAVGTRWIAAIELLGYVAIGAGLTFSVYYKGDEGGRFFPVLSRLIRWLCRLGLGGLLVWNAVRLRRVQGADAGVATSVTAV